MLSDRTAPVRLEFAKRLRRLRTEKGFPKARLFAKRLGIEENRYTRYERAEVEPNLTLICRICQTLGITPNDLLDFGGASSGREQQDDVPAE
jgi:transcriptional regulator with XRE-family HTH domain